MAPDSTSMEDVDHAVAAQGPKGKSSQILYMRTNASGGGCCPEVQGQWLGKEAEKVKLLNWSSPLGQRSIAVAALCSDCEPSLPPSTTSPITGISDAGDGSIKCD